jgi:plasmid maintenance system killer protein
VEITFISRKLQKVCNSEKEMRAMFGKPLAERLKQRLAELKAADTLEDIRRLPPARCHELSQNRKGSLLSMWCTPNDSSSSRTIIRCLASRMVVSIGLMSRESE